MENELVAQKLEFNESKEFATLEGNLTLELDDSADNPYIPDMNMLPRHVVNESPTAGGEHKPLESSFVSAKLVISRIGICN